MKEPVFLVMIDKALAQTRAIEYAARRAKVLGGHVALLYVVEPVGIEAWGGVEKAVLDDAFDAARKEMLKHEAFVLNLSGREAKTYYRKGERMSALVDLIETHQDISSVVVAAKMDDGSKNPMMQSLLSDKGLKKMIVPIIVVPEGLRSDEAPT
ncbi:MAG: universal stress protein [Proteobacteria bacterium]|jgi:nucleotide-binding universal stress UspA family protein|nr:universal stress protein [Alphaproteobacteria bacterium]NCC03781.1 universal stress protein [Pseudomonadota bacterium]